MEYTEKKICPYVIRAKVIQDEYEPEEGTELVLNEEDETFAISSTRLQTIELNVMQYCLEDKCMVYIDGECKHGRQ